ncbi:MAG: PEGA domain-containing protein [Magnetococcales bacterium]|nr:PEGA domain-containing protein [Magnetococcales bacterium]
MSPFSKEDDTQTTLEHLENRVRILDETLQHRSREVVNRLDALSERMNRRLDALTPNSDPDDALPTAPPRSSRQVAIAYQGMAVRAMQIGDAAEAELAACAAVASNPQNAEMLFTLAWVLHDSGRLDEAEAEYRRTIARAPRHDKAWNNLGNVLELQHRLEEAVQAWSRAADLGHEGAQETCRNHGTPSERAASSPPEATSTTTKTPAPSPADTLESRTRGSDSPRLQETAAATPENRPSGHRASPLRMGTIIALVLGVVGIGAFVTHRGTQSPASSTVVSAPQETAATTSPTPIPTAEPSQKAPTSGGPEAGIETLRPAPSTPSEPPRSLIPPAPDKPMVAEATDPKTVDTTPPSPTIKAIIPDQEPVLSTPTASGSETVQESSHSTASNEEMAPTAAQRSAQPESEQARTTTHSGPDEQTTPFSGQTALFIDPTPADAVVRIMDIRPAYEPGILLDQRVYRVRVEKPGYTPVERPLSVSGKRMQVPITLEPLPGGTLTVETLPLTAKTQILNIVPRYESGMFLAPGRYHVRVEAPGFRTVTTWVTLENRDRTMRIELEELPSHDASLSGGQTHALTINTIPAGGTVRVMNIANPFQNGMQLPPDDYRVELSKPGHQTKKIWVRISDRDRTLNIRLQTEQE